MIGQTEPLTKGAQWRNGRRVCLLAIAVLAAACTGGDDNAGDTPTTVAITESTESPSTPAEEAPDASTDDASADSSDEAEEAVAAAAQSIDWAPCGPIECGTLTVPLDHDAPDGDTIDLAVYRYRAPSADPIGSLFVNYGGPGAESGEIFEFDAEFLADSFTDRFDLITWDPRGIGETEGLACTLLEADVDLAPSVDLSDGVDSELAELDEYAAALNGCAEEHPVSDHLSTTDGARDLDLLRQAVGDEQLTYLGYSYGTQLGWVYATLFPDRVRAMVLDGALPDEYFDNPTYGAAQLAGFERSFQHMVDVCEREMDCSAAEEGLDVRVERVAAALAADPIPLADGSLWGEAEFRSAVLGTLYLSPADVGADLDRWITEVDEGRDPLGFIEFEEFSIETSTLGAYEAVTCADGAVGPIDEASVNDVLAAHLEASPTFGSIPFLLPCAAWTGEITPLPDLDTTGAPTIVVIGNTLDPATPYEDAVLLDEQLADSVLLTYEGAGHTIVSFDFCIDDLVVPYLEDLRVPEPSTCFASTPIYGVQIQEQPGNDGLFVVDVQFDSGADIAGLQVGDRLVSIDGVAIETPDDVIAAQVGVTRLFVVERDGDTLEFEVTPRAQPWT